MNDKSVKKVDAAEVAFEVYDNDSGKRVPVTLAMQTEAMRAMQQIQAGTVVLALNLQKIKDGKLYLCFTNERGKNYTSWRDFVEGELTKVGIGYSTAQRYYRVADHFGTALERLVASVDSADISNVGNRKSLPLSKIDELTFLPPEKIDELNDTDQLTTDDGKTYTLAQLLDLKHKDLVAEVKRLKKSTREAEEAKAEAEAVATSLNDQMEQLGDANETAKALIETRKQLEKLEGEKVTRDRALEYWKKVDDGIMSLLTIAENIPLTRNHETDGYGRRVIENIILKAHNIATEKKFNVLGLSGEDS